MGKRAVRSDSDGSFCWVGGFLAETGESGRKGIQRAAERLLTAFLLLLKDPAPLCSAGR